MTLKNIRKFIKKIPYAKILYQKCSNNFNKLKKILNMKNNNLYKKIISNLKLRYLSKKIETDPKSIEKIISLSIYKNHRQLLKLIDKSIYFQKRKLLSLKNNLEKCEEYFLLGRLFFYKGDTTNFLKYLSLENELREELLKNSEYSGLNEIFIPRNTIHVLGLIGHLDGIIKYFKLNSINKKINVIGDAKTIVNDYFFSLYKKYINFIDINIIDDELLNKEKFFFKNVHWVLPDKNNKLQLCHKTLAYSVSKWKEQKFEPLIEIPFNDQKEIKNFKKSQRIPENSKLICIHIRTNEFYNSHNKLADDYRDSKFDTYINSINYLNSLGFYVVRIGEKINDPVTFGQLNKKDMFIDYPNTIYKSGKMDLLLTNESVFFIATDSGPHWYAGSLLKNLCIINSPIKDGFPYYKNTIFLPLKYKINGNELHFKEILNLYTNCHFQWQFENQDIEIEKNSEEEIKKTIEESLFECGLIDDYDYYDKDLLTTQREEFIHLNNIYKTNILSKPAEVYFNRLNSM